jgi:hypothetical protein
MDPNPTVSCPDVDQNLWRYIDRELSASALAAISSHLRACETCQGLYHERAREASQYRMVFVDSPFGEPFVVKLKRRLRQEAPAAPGGASGRQKLTGFFSLRHRKVRRALAVAAMLVLIPVVILIGFLQKSSETRWLGSFEAKNEGKVSLFAPDAPRDDNVSLPLQNRGRYGPGYGIGVPKGEEAYLDYGESQITLHGPAFLRMDANSTRDRFVAYLDTGKLEAKVAPLSRDQDFVIRTDHAVARVVGTRFTVDARDKETILDVQEGIVKFQSASVLPGTHLKSVEAGQSYRMHEDAEDPEPVVDAAAREASPEASEAQPSAAVSVDGPAASPAKTPESAPAVTEASSDAGAPPAVEPKPPAKSGDGTPNADLDQPVTR